MDYDLVIRGGRIVDGSGMPGFIGDVAVKNGRIAEVGRPRGSATRTIDADGLVVSPGFIDHHTHLDAQMFWDPWGTSEPMHGITTVIMGNCALSLAPVRDEEREGIVKTFTRVEAIPRAVLEEAIPWGWHTYGEYLDSLEGRVGINVGGLVGHVALRQYVLGEESVERTATTEEVARMRQLLQESMAGGALGLSINRNPVHYREDGKPNASRLADDAEMFALVEALGETGGGTIESSRGPSIEWHNEIARRSGRPIVWGSLHHEWKYPDEWSKQLKQLAALSRDGYRSYGMANSVIFTRDFTLKNCPLFDDLPEWKNVMFLPEPIRKQVFADAAQRDRLRQALERPEKNFHGRWDVINVMKTFRPENVAYIGLNVAEIAKSRGTSPLDAFLDLSLSEELEATFRTPVYGDEPEPTAEILGSDYTIVGVSDAGAHIQVDAAFGYGTTLLSRWVRELKALTLERAIHKLSFQVASIYGIEGRGLLRPAYAADIAVFDPERVQPGKPERVTDFPQATSRLIQRCEGMHYTIVNGVVVCEEGEITGEVAGSVMRGNRHVKRATAAQSR